MIAKVAVLFAVLAAVRATAVLHGVALASTGTSVSSRQQDSLGNFAFRYDIADGAHVRSHAEVGSAAPVVHAAYVPAPAVVAAHAAPAAVVTSYAAPVVAAAHVAAPAVVPAPYAYGKYAHGGLLLNHGLGLYNKLVL